MSVKPPTPGLDDFPIWKFSNDGLFSIKSAYQTLFVEESIIVPSLNFSWYGGGNALLKFNIFCGKLFMVNFLLMLKGNIVEFLNKVS